MPPPILVIADIHGNLEALKAVLAETDGLISETWVLGDVAGYGPDPGACLTILRNRSALILPGNHDWAVCGKLDIDDFNDEARAAVLVHRALLSAAEKDYLAALPETVVRGSVTLCHGAPRRPVWGYVMNTAAAAGALAEAETSLTLVGHTHRPALWAYHAQAGARAVDWDYGREQHYTGVPHLGNPGSVGQSRDGDPAARYMLLDPERKTLELRRCRWRSGPTRRKMKKLGLPAGLIERMAPKM